MINERIHNPPTNDLFIIFATYGGLLILTCTSIVWPMSWSGMASLGTFYLIMIAPIVMGIIVYKHRKTKNISKYHNGVYLAGLLYFVIAPLTFAMLFLTSNNLLLDELQNTSGNTGLAAGSYAFLFNSQEKNDRKRLFTAWNLIILFNIFTAKQPARRQA